MQPSKISIILPIYKVEAYLPACVESILAQSYQNFELILVDDGSPDGCPALCDAYAAQDSRVRVIHQKNGGLSAARNSGIDAASGDYIAFVDSDDWVRANYIEVLYTLLSQTKSDMAQCGFERVCTDEEPAIGAATVHCYTGEEMCGSLCKSATYLEGVVVWNKLYARTLFEEIRFPEGRIHEDEATTYRLFWQAQKVAVTTQCLYFYRQRPCSITSSGFSRKSMDGLTALEDRAAFYHARGAKKLQALTLLDLCGMAQDLRLAATEKGDGDLAAALQARSVAAYRAARACGALRAASRLELALKCRFPKLWSRARTLYHQMRGK